MAGAKQLKALLKSHLEGDEDRFFPVAMQVAAHEARRGHGSLAGELRALIDDARSRRGAESPIPISRPRGESANLLEASWPKVRLGAMTLGKELAEQRQRVIREQRHAGRILEHGLAPRFILEGVTGSVPNSRTMVVQETLQPFKREPGGSPPLATCTSMACLGRSMFWSIG